MATQERKRNIDEAKSNLRDDGTSIVLDAGDDKLERLQNAGFDPNGNKVQTLCSEECIEISLPKEIYHQYTKYGKTVWSLFDLSKATAQDIAELVAQQAAIGVQACTAFHVKDSGAEYFYTEVSEDGLKGERAERSGGSRYSFSKMLDISSRAKKGTAISDEEREYYRSFKDKFVAEWEAAQNATPGDL